MIPTVQKAMRPSEPPTPESLNVWARRELLPFLVQVRQALNYVNRAQATYQSNALGTYQTIWTSQDIAVGTAAWFEVRLIGAEGSNVGVFYRTAVFHNDGTLVQDGVTTTLYINNPGGYAMQFLVVANHVEVQAQDAGATVNWTAIVDVIEQVIP